MSGSSPSQNGLGYTGIDPTQQPSFRSYNRTPTANDYIDFRLGDQWRDTTVTPPNIYILKSVSANSATWQLIGSGSGSTTFPAGVLSGDGTTTPLSSVVTQHAPIIGDITNKVLSTAALTDGQILIGSTGAAPAPANITGGTGISIVSGAGSITANLDSPVSVSTGGTGATTLTGALTGNGTGAITGSAITQHAVLIGGASNAISSLPNGTAGQVLTANTAAPPSWQTASGGEMGQVVTNTITTQVTTDALIPVDTSIPTSSEGLELLAVTITPNSATSNIVILFCGVVYQNANASGLVTLFKDAGTSALATAWTHRSSAAINIGSSVNLHYTEVAGSTAARTYRIRFGKIAGTGTIFCNLSGDFGTSSATRLTAMEIP